MIGHYGSPGYIADCEGVLRRHVTTLLRSPDDHRLHDMLQEGRIALWRTHSALADMEEPFRTGMAIKRAKQRMLAIYQGASHTGHSEKPAHEPKAVSLEAPTGDVTTSDYVPTLGDLLSDMGGLEDIEIAYHYGEIKQAFDALTPKQKQFVYARFWCGIDMPNGSRNEGIKQAKDQNPILRRDVLWTGNKTTTGAKQRLAESLAHLRELVSAA